MQNKLINCKNLGILLTAILMLNLSLTVFVPIFFATYFTPFPTDEQIEAKIQTQKIELLHILWWLLATSISVVVLLFLTIFNGLDVCDQEGYWKGVIGLIKRLLSSPYFLIIIAILVCISVCNTYNVYVFVKDSLAVTISRTLIEEIGIGDEVFVEVARNATGK